MTTRRSLWSHLALEGNIRVLAAQTLVSQLGFGMLYVVWQPYLLSTGIDVVELGIIQTIINLSSTAGLLVWGFLSDAFGRKPVILASNLCRIIALISLIISSNIVFLILFSFFIGFSALFMQYNPARSALTSESVEHSRLATAFSTLMAINQLTMTVASSAGGYLAYALGFYIIFYICLVVDITGLAIMALFIKETRRGSLVRIDPSEFTIRRMVDYLRPERGLGVLYSIMLVMGLGYGVGYSLLFAFLVESYGLTTIQLGIISTAFSLTWGVSSIPVGKLSDRMGRKPLLLASWTMGLITVVGYLTFQIYELFLLLQVANALDPTFWTPAWMALVAEITDSRNLSTVMGKLDAYTKLIGIPAPWIGGLLYSYFGFKAPMVVHLAMLILSGALLLRMREPKRSIVNHTNIL